MNMKRQRLKESHAKSSLILNESIIKNIEYTVTETEGKTLNKEKKQTNGQRESLRTLVEILTILCVFNLQIVSPG